MCGIAGIVAFNDNGKKFIPNLSAAVYALLKRGPDGEGVWFHENTALGHRRLAIIDTLAAANQPFSDPTGRYTIVFNGEFFNYCEYRENLQAKGVVFKTTSDTEVLLHLYIQEGASCINKINGFFAFAIYDKQTGELFVARDRYGIKPLYIYRDEDKLIFASEMKSLLAFKIAKEIDYTSLYTYLQLNYIPYPNSIFKNVMQLETGCYLQIKNGQITQTRYYSIPYKQSLTDFPSYNSAKKQLVQLMDEAVQRRMISDVPLGSFLSGGIDSSVITALAAQHVVGLKTFSIGYKDEPFFDETHYAQLVAKKWKTDHTVFSLSNDDLFANLHQVLDYIDEPFADSSALAVHILSMHTRKHVTVALSGDGADELFAGYNKHEALLRAKKMEPFAAVARIGSSLLAPFPKSRNSFVGNKVRQLSKLLDGLSMSDRERYWRWAGYISEEEAEKLLRQKFDKSLYRQRKENELQYINADFNSLLLTDMQLVLRGDMLRKVDLMSMANCLEVRTPFLDVNVVDFAFSLPVEYKIQGSSRKRILKDAFKDHLPVELYTRGKKGFEVPLLKWFQTELRSTITDDLLSDRFVEEQGVFHVEYTRQLKEKLFSGNPGDAAAQTWALIVFQYWWKKYFNN